MRLIKFVLLFFVALFVICVSLFAVTYLLLPKLESPVSILVLGMGDENHTAARLTDTVILEYLNTTNNKISSLSLPRDIWVPAIRAKLNTAYYYGGFEMIRDSVESVTGISPDYYMIIDFSLFKDLIDTVGGVEVDVDNAFIDVKYPIAGLENDLCNGDKSLSCRYETLRFTEGLQLMSGEMALKFVRSRNSEGPEGTDLARVARQQKVVEAIKQKVLSKEVILNPKMLLSLKEVLTSHLETNINIKTTISLFRFVIKNINNINFLNFPEEFVEVSQNNPKFDKQYVFIPKEGDWKSFQEWIKKEI